MLRFEHLPGKDNPVADALSRGVKETKKPFTNEPILDNFGGEHHEKPRAKTNASANPVILRHGQDPQECTTKDCESLARGNTHGLCHGCWATAYEKKKKELLGPGTTWAKAAEEVKQTAASERKRKIAGQFEMRGKKPGGPKETRIECSSYFSCADGARSHQHSRFRDAGDREQADKRRAPTRRRRRNNQDSHSLE